MTVLLETSTQSYVGNGITVSFATVFRFFKNTDLVVTLQPSGGTATLQTLGSNYSVTGAGSDAGGNVVFVTPPPSGSTVVITRTLDYTQATAFRTQGPFSAAVHEAAFDAAAMRDQQLDRRLDVIEDAIASGTLGSAGAQRGRATILAGATSVTVTNSMVTPTSVVIASLQTLDATLTYVRAVPPGVGLFTIIGGPWSATSDVTVAWSVGA